MVEFFRYLPEYLVLRHLISSHSDCTRPAGQGLGGFALYAKKKIGLAAGFLLAVSGLWTHEP